MILNDLEYNFDVYNYVIQDYSFEKESKTLSIICCYNNQRNDTIKLVFYDVALFEDGIMKNVLNRKLMSVTENKASGEFLLDFESEKRLAFAIHSSRMEKITIS